MLPQIDTHSNLEIRYNNKKIILSFNPFSRNYSSFLKINVKAEGSKIIKSDSEFFESYGTSEQEAQLYLIKNAIDSLHENSVYRLREISGILQDVICTPIKEGLELEVILKGIALFKKIKNPSR
ncbi:hypothetical protein ES705_45211 [subsurface metagenome]